MRAFKLKNGNLLIPRQAKEGEVLGDGMEEIEQDSPEYEKWLPYAEPVEPKEA